jgi:hypothetical protein
MGQPVEWVMVVGKFNNFDPSGPLGIMRVASD